jgi:predicted Zn-dependent peptidase
LQAVIDQQVGEADLRKARNRMETAFWQGLASSEGRANQLGEFEVVAGDYRKLFSRPEEIGRVTAADVQRVAKAYLGGKGRVVAVARPKAAGSRREAGS